MLACIMVACYSVIVVASTGNFYKLSKWGRFLKSLGTTDLQIAVA